jgi:GSH-dependent disulfide-bond oxidoreductase
MLHPVEARWKFEDPSKIQLFSMPTPNGVKANAALEELGLPYEAHRVDIMAGDQHTDAYRTLSPNGKIPAIVDPDGPGGEPIGVMESGAILIYLADKAGKLIPQDARGRSECLQWLFFQVGHVGPMFGQFGHFHKLARGKTSDEYALERYTSETERLLDVLEQRLSDRAYLVGDDYSIADLAVWPWVQGLADFYQATERLGLKERGRLWDWYERCHTRPASERGKQINGE